ncbi:hypothetical protein UFOVP1290_504 [uncultured Caudovirales phage]|uniref:Uncharacterized protein n=1 Tax=uncultured Caudovirales phage TaxID=2100421 RepID=A0A6J5RY35_9CAUD|nr:hypothetical protein UFOVP1290_504 [uncultured Caudovirales phage]
MKLLKCKLCSGEVDIIGTEHSVNKKIKCTKCGYSNTESNKVEPEILIIRRKPQLQ